MQELAQRGTKARFNPANARHVDSAAVAAVTIDRPARDLYDFWRNFENLARVFDNIIAIKTLDEQRSHWRVKSAGGDRPFEWVARVVEDQPGERIAWESEVGAEIANSGWIEFVEAPLGRGTEVRAFITYAAPLGVIGDVAAKLMRKDPATLARIELRRFKQLMETGEVAVSARNRALLNK
jgi:uncharacterized membrane protein